MRYVKMAAIALASFPAACASVVDGSTQTISVSTAPEVGANCTLTNKRGEWSVVTPGSVVVKRSESTLHGHCVKDGYDDGNAYIAAETDNTSLVGMLVPYVGLVETAVDASTGATSKYPTSYTIRMKRPSAAAQPTAAPSSLPKEPITSTTKNSVSSSTPTAPHT